jgi:hypothetical protein
MLLPPRSKSFKLDRIGYNSFLKLEQLVSSVFSSLQKPGVSS